MIDVAIFGRSLLIGNECAALDNGVLCLCTMCLATCALERKCRSPVIVADKVRLF